MEISALCVTLQLTKSSACDSGLMTVELLTLSSRFNFPHIITMANDYFNCIQIVDSNINYINKNTTTIPFDFKSYDT